ncbi:hypothetical protein HPB47_008925 [Ixodes persulcatus]|uniref:Uncharacterized protein n=1 Tax=Ixodes persulcatus TaxID=34615 RepID=A0AC60P3D8_IXOPE|nr:hypothetical protein HPB47_008925 [Ixodes persulcatus]
MFDMMARRYSRDHRQALRTLGKAPETLRLWEEYQKLKAITQSIVEEKKQSHDCKVMKDIRKGGKRAGEKFWRYIGTLDGRDNSPQLIDAKNGGVVHNVRALLDEHLHNLFGTTQDFHGNESVSAGGPYINDPPLPNLTSDSTTMVGRVQVARALARLNGGTAQGLDGIRKRY